MPSKSVSDRPQTIHRPGSDHIELFRVDRLQHCVEARTLVAALGATDAGIFVDLDDLPARATGDRLQLPALVLVLVSCFEVETRR